IGTGLVMARLADGGWSAPSAIGTLGLSWGAIIGLDVTDYVLILNTDEAVEAFSGAGQITIGVGMEVAVGPVGRSGSADYHISDTGAAPAFSYSQSRGLFAGLSLDGSVILARNDVNHRFYGRVVTPADLLSGRVAPPRNAAPLYDAL
ncbi:Ysc84 actin-binding domain-containing protein, partial [Ochromonadaceae sp. CCMP2298]